MIPNYISLNKQINPLVKTTSLYEDFEKKENELKKYVLEINKILKKYEYEYFNSYFKVLEDGQLRLFFKYNNEEKYWNGYYSISNKLLSNDSSIMNALDKKKIYNNMFSLIEEIESNINIGDLNKCVNEVLKSIKKLLNYKESSIEEQVNTIKKEFKQSKKDTFNLIIESLKNRDQKFICSFIYNIKNGVNKLYIQDLNYKFNRLEYYKEENIFKDRSTTSAPKVIKEIDMVDYLKLLLKDQSYLYIYKSNEKSFKKEYNLNQTYLDENEIKELSELINVKNNIKDF